MTIRQLFEWGMNNDALDLHLSIKYQNDGFTFDGSTLEDNWDIWPDVQRAKIMGERREFVLLDSTRDSVFY